MTPTVNILIKLSDMHKRKSAERKSVFGLLQGKVSKQEANYRYPQSGVKTSCIECTHFLREGSEISDCRRVAGPVAAEDVCDLFAAKTVDG